MNRGVSCVLKDTSLEKAEAGKAYFGEDPRAPGREMNPLMLIKATADIHDLAGCDLIIEAVFEKRDLKAQVTKGGEPIAGRQRLSSPPTLHAADLRPCQGLAHPEKFMPAFLLAGGSDGTGVSHQGRKDLGRNVVRPTTTCCRAAKSAPIVVNDSRGFFTSRYLQHLRA